MNVNRKRVLAGLAATGILAGAAAGGGVALASAGPARTPAATTAAQPASGWCDPADMRGIWSGQQPVLTAAAGYLGVSQSQLLSQLQAGKSLAGVAKAQGKPVTGLKNAILAAMTSRINASTGLSAAQKTAMTSDVKSHLDAIVTRTHPSGAGTGWMHSPAQDAGSPMGAMGRM
jgi:hypothetical protein